MPDTKAELISIQTLNTSHFRPPHKNEVNTDPYTEIKSISTTHTTTKSISSLHRNQIERHPPHGNQVNFDRPHTKPSQSIPAFKTSQLRPAHKNKSTSITQKTSRFRSPHNNKKADLISTPTLIQVNFDSYSENKSMSMPPDTKAKLISVQTLINEVLFDPHTQSSQFRSLHWNQVNSDPTHWNQVYFNHPHKKQVSFDVNTKTMSFSAFCCVLYIRVHFPVIEQQYVSLKYE